MNASLRLEQLIALNDELLALIRSGVPLEAGLTDMARDMPGYKGQATRELAEILQRGAPLDQAVAAMEDRLPRAYVALVIAGMRSGRLTAALEQTAIAARRLLELRQSISLALFYPLLVIVFAYGLAVWYLTNVAPSIMSIYRQWQVPTMPALMRVIQALPPAWVLIAAGCITLVVLYWCLWRPYLGRTTLNHVGRRRRWRRGFGLWQTAYYARLAALVEIMVLLIEHDTPMDESLVLAAEVADDPALISAANAAAADFKRGTPVTAAGLESCGFPPTLAWLLASSSTKAELTHGLRNAVQLYTEETQSAAAFAQTLAPVAFLVFIAGTATLAWALLIFAPYAWSLHEVSNL